MGAIAFALSQTVPLPVTMTYVLLCISGVGIHSYRGGFWALPSQFLTDKAAAASLGLINSLGNLGGFAGPYAVGFFSTRTGNYKAGIAYLIASAVAGAMFTLAVSKKSHHQ